MPFNPQADLAGRQDLPRTAGQSTMKRRDFIVAGATSTAALAAASLTPTAHADILERGAEKGSKDLQGQVALVTGGARGIGRACAEELAKAGAHIVLFDIAAQIKSIPYPLANENDLAAAKAAVESYGVRCLAVKGDVRDRAAQVEAVAQATQQFGRLDILVANAGVTQLGVIEELPDAESQAVLDINVGGVIKSIQAVAPVFRKQNSGRIVSIASVLGRMGNDLFPIYASTKWAVIGITKSAALDLAKHKVMCNTVCPGLVHTKLIDNEYALKGMQTPTWEALEDFLGPQNPLALGSYEPIDMARIVRFFCGPETSKVTGEVFDISAGTGARSIG